MSRVTGRLPGALLIVIVSVLGAVMAWQASIYNERSANTDENSRQGYVQREQIRAQQTQDLIADARAYALYEEAINHARELDRDAGGAGAGLATRLRDEAQAERSRARAMEATFRVVRPIETREDGPLIDLENGREIQGSSTELQSLKPDDQRAEARADHETSVQLTALAALFVLALFFLTVAEVARRSVGRWFLPIGVSIASIGLVGFVAVIL